MSDDLYVGKCFICFDDEGKRKSQGAVLSKDDEGLYDVVFAEPWVEKTLFIKRYLRNI
jgi:hypothetical protein